MAYTHRRKKPIERAKFLERNLPGVPLLLGIGGFFLTSLYYAAQTKYGYILIAAITFGVGGLLLVSLQYRFLKEGKRMLRLISIYIAVLCFIGAMTSGCIYIYFGAKNTEIVKDPLREVMVRDSFANSIIIVLRLGRFSVPDDTQCDILRQQDDKTWISERSIGIDRKDYIVARALKPGLYRVELSFYGIRQDVVGDLHVGSQKGHYIELTNQGFVGCLNFKVVKKDDSPLENAHVILYTHKDIPIRTSDTNSAGETIRLYVASVLYDEDYYTAKVYYPGKAGLEVGRSEKIVVRFAELDRTKTIKVTTSVE